MDKDFFDSFADRRGSFAERAGLSPDEIRAQAVLGNGRTYDIDDVVETADGWVQLDVRDPEDHEQLRSLVLPYYQIHNVLLTRARRKVSQPGFTG